MDGVGANKGERNFFSREGRPFRRASVMGGGWSRSSQGRVGHLGMPVLWVRGEVVPLKGRLAIQVCQCYGWGMKPWLHPLPRGLHERDREREK